MKYSINEVFITNYVIYSTTEKKFMELPSYCLPYKIVIYEKDDCYTDFTREDSCHRQYTKYKSIEERDTEVFWGDLKSIYLYLNSGELKSGVISHERLIEIYHLINGIQTKEDIKEFIRSL